eukprot:1197318-Lingulodinium_polyedra.AAC.1
MEGGQLPDLRQGGHCGAHWVGGARQEGAQLWSCLPVDPRAGRPWAGWAPGCGKVGRRSRAEASGDARCRGEACRGDRPFPAAAAA